MRLVKQLQADLYKLTIETNWYASRANKLEDKLEALVSHLGIGFEFQKAEKAYWTIRENK